ncbi:cupin domain-containing protein [Microtetraspora malaysiensis]|uniref:cupin domain-containing protein n=1 Tax=Microtetraspora malaysiensis TaxID=161358 RepID=UPI003D907E2A
MKFVGERQLRATKAPPEKFTGGNVWETSALEELRPDGLRALRFSYEPGARSCWHVHDGEQALYILSGRGVVTRWGETEGREVGPGDWVHVEPGEKHWHGAMADTTFEHLAVTATGATHWYEPVSDQEYRAGHGAGTGSADQADGGDAG